MKIAIVTTGNEIMAGNIVDSNAAWISDRCWMLGHDVVLHMAVGDSEDCIGDALKIAAERADVIIVSGGLGATVDDLTLKAAAKSMGLEMVFHKEIWKGILGFFKRVNRVCSENNKRQAYLPEGAVALPNTVGTAPGVRLSLHCKEYFFVPGVPAEMKQIFDGSILPWLKRHSETPGYCQKFLRCFGLPEATFDQMIRGVDIGGVDLSFRVTFPDIRIKLVARSKRDAQSKKMVGEAALKIREVIGEYVYGEDEETLEHIICNLLINKNYCLVIAESCTGGLISDRLTDIPGSSRYLERAYVAYSNRSKAEDLGVSDEILKMFGAVSEEAATAMAEGAIRATGADIGLSVTGIAGPAGGTDEKPVGTVHIAVAGPNGVRHQKYLFPHERSWFKQIVASTALDMLRRYLLGVL